MPQQKKPNFKPQGNKKSGGQKDILSGTYVKSKGQSGSGGNSRKTHDTKGKNNHGRSF